MIQALPALPPAELDEVASAPAVDWPALRGARILLTGGTGFFGSWLVESFRYANAVHHLGATLTVLSRDPAAFLAARPFLAGETAIEFLVGDVRSFEFPERPVTHVLHAATAASAALNAARPDEMLSTIVDGTRRVLEFASKAGVSRFLNVSSGAVYGVQPPDLAHVPETYTGAPDPLDRGSAYAQGKRVAEHLGCLFSSAALQVVPARAFAFVGPHLPLGAHFAAGNFLRDVLNEQTIQIGGDGTPRRSYLYPTDLAIWLWALLNRGVSNRAYNVGSEHDVSIESLARTAAALGSVAVDVAQKADPSRLPARYVPSTERARAELGLTETVALDEALRRTLAWHRIAPRKA